MKSLPRATDAARVGQYLTLARSGGGYFFDDVLEYRVWVHPPGGGDDLCHSFECYEDAFAFAAGEPGAEDPLVLVLQREWIDEPEPGSFSHKSGERITEWRVEWLEGGARTPESIALFLKQRSHNA
jgi:putative acetyltransferase